MKLRVFTHRLDPSSGVFDDAELVAFLADREALSVSDHYLVHDQVPTLALLVTYREPPRPGAESRPRADAGPEVGEATRGLFEALRRWRNERAKRDGRPSYILFNNMQLAEIARTRPTTLTALGALSGIGDAKLRDYGEDVLAVVRVGDSADTPPG